MREQISHARLIELLSYDPDTGLFTWLRTRSRLARQGAIAGNNSDGRYVVIQVDGISYYAHRLAWFYAHQTWPPIIDHVDGDGLNNCLGNLRLATKSLNAANAKIPRTNTSGAKGVCWDASIGKWWAQIKVRGKPRYLGAFDTIEDASEAYKAAAAAAFGEYAR